MKNIVFLLCLIFIVFTFSAQAQTPNSQDQQDTLMVKLQDRSQVFLIGKSLKNLSDYKRADSLKALFFTDLEKSLAANNFPETPKRIHYFVNLAGKRRLKAEIPGETETSFDLDYEKKRMQLDLPALHYTIYDLPGNVEVHFFMADTTAFKTMRTTSLNSAIQ